MTLEHYPAIEEYRSLYMKTLLILSSHSAGPMTISLVDNFDGLMAMLLGANGRIVGP
jgi:hypothetical protein